MSTRTHKDLQAQRYKTERGANGTIAAEVILTESTTEFGAGPTSFDIWEFDRGMVGGANASFSVEVPATNGTPKGAAMTFTVKYSNDRKTWFSLTAQDETGTPQGGAAVNVAAGAKEHFLVPFVDFPEAACMRYLALFGQFQADPAGDPKAVKVFATML